MFRYQKKSIKSKKQYIDFAQRRVYVNTKANPYQRYFKNYLYLKMIVSSFRTRRCGVVIVLAVDEDIYETL